MQDFKTPDGLYQYSADHLIRKSLRCALIVRLHQAIKLGQLVLHGLHICTTSGVHQRPQQLQGALDGLSVISLIQQSPSLRTIFGLRSMYKTLSSTSTTRFQDVVQQLLLLHVLWWHFTHDNGPTSAGNSVQDVLRHHTA
jgi:hypothetical protein